eukprot:8717004-Pyramimonas_sp.AAC.1
MTCEQAWMTLTGALAVPHTDLRNRFPTLAGRCLRGKKGYTHAATVSALSSIRNRERRVRTRLVALASSESASR